LSAFGSFVVYLLVGFTFLIGFCVEVALVWLCFGEWKARREYTVPTDDSDCCVHHPSPKPGHGGDD
jgi:hypothetical protein